MTLHEFCDANGFEQMEQALAEHLDLILGHHDDLTEVEYMVAYTTIVNQWLDRA